MRVAVIADVHGNSLALEAVLDDIRRQNVSDVVNLGDHLSGPLESARTANMLIGYDFPSIRGNHDRCLVEQTPDQWNKSDRAAGSQLTQPHRDWLAHLAPTLVWHGEVLLCHGTPRSDTTYWLEQVSRDGSVTIASAESIEREADGFDYPLILCGHTHIPRSVRLVDGRLVVNPGSVGLPAYDDDRPVPHVMQTGSPDARYAIVEKTGERWSACFRQVGYPHEKMSALARSRDRPDWATALVSGRLD